MRTRVKGLVALVALGMVATAGADTLVIESVNQSAAVERPARGETMAAVEARYGKPREADGPIGEPPITRWVYDGFTVYFEGDRVVRAVAAR